MFAHNERLLRDVRADRPWAWLVSAETWPEWYLNSARVRVDGAASSLTPGARFSWVTFGTRVRSEVVQFERHRRLGWLWWCPGAYGFHGWELTTDPDGTRVVTEESQRGPRAHALATILRPALWLAHHHWLHRLAARAASDAGPPA